MLLNRIEKHKSRILQAALHNRMALKTRAETYAQMLGPIRAELFNLTLEAVGEGSEEIEVVIHRDEDHIQDGFLVVVPNAVTVGVWITPQYRYHVMLSAAGGDVDYDVRELEYAMYYMGEGLAPYIKLKEAP